ncbi:MAG: hypothetical protein ACLFOY_10580 [Desulfatibacillaceae bacterium]
MEPAVNKGRRGTEPDRRATEATMPARRVAEWFRVRPRALFALNAGAPVFLFAVAFGRCYIESAVLASRYFFSYYTACHHVIWYWSTFLTLLLAAHFILGKPIRRLLWLAYGTIAMGIPPLYSVVTDTPLDLEYFQGPLHTIVFHILTFCWFYDAARPVAPELMLIFFGMWATGWLATGNARRGAILGIVVYLLVCALATQWVGVAPNTVAPLIVESRLTNHVLQAMVFLHVFTALVLVTAWRAGAFSRNPRLFLKAAAAGAAAQTGFTAAVWASGWLTHPFDVLTSGLPIGTDVFFLAVLAYRGRGLLRGWTVALFTGLFFVQLVVWGPVFLKMEYELLPNVDKAVKMRRVDK